MPIYEYRCKECDHVTDAYRSVDNRNDVPECESCSGETKKIISAYHMHGDLTPYYDENLETHIQSKQHRRQVMAAQGVEEHFGQGWHTSARKVRKA